MRAAQKTRKILSGALLVGLLLGGAGWGASAQDEWECTVVRLFDGRELRGVILKQTPQELLLRTWTGDKRILRQNIVDFRRNLTADERAAILRTISPQRDEQAWKERDRKFAAGKKVDTPKVDAPKWPDRERPGRKGGVPAAPDIRPRRALALSAPPAQGHWAQRMSAALDKRLTLELVDEKLEDAITLIGALTGLNLIINPKVREAGPKVSLNVHSMDAASVLRWLTRLTDTYVELHDQALYITDKPSAKANNEERDQLAMMMAANGVDLALLPPVHTELTDADRAKIAQAIWEKTNPKIQDFPGPDIGLVPEGQGGGQNPFAVPGN